VQASESIELLARSRVFATLTAPVVKVEEGAFFQGTCQMSEKGTAKVAELAGLKNE
jgi:cytoskeletal protein CcmA (bactofilin family)